MSAARETARERERPLPPPESLGMGDLLVELAETFGVPDTDEADKSGLRREILRRAIAAQAIVDAVRRAGDVTDPYADDGEHTVAVVDAFAAVAGDSANLTEEAQRRVEREADARRALQGVAEVLRGGLVDALHGLAPRDPMGLALAVLPPGPENDVTDELAPLRAVLRWGAANTTTGTASVAGTNGTEGTG